DAGGIGAHRADTTYGRFQLRDVVRRQPSQLTDPVGERLPLIVAQRVELRCIRRDDDLAAAPVRHAVLLAVAIQQRLAAHAEARLRAAGVVIDARVDDFRVSAAGFRADLAVSFEHDHIAARARELPRARESDDAGADDDHVDALSHAETPSRGRRAIARRASV